MTLLHASLETPYSGISQAGEIRFSGWCCHPHQRILEVFLNVGGQGYACTYGLERTDILDAHPSFKNSLLSGFETLVSMPAGKYKIRLDALLDNGLTVSLDIDKLLTIRALNFGSLMIKELSSMRLFLRFSWVKSRAWCKSRGRLPKISEIAGLFMKAVYAFRQINTSIECNVRPPNGFQFSEKIELYNSWLDHNNWNVRRNKELLFRLSEFKDLPLLSIVMPVYNSSLLYLKIAIESVRSQVYENWELCIADDCSVDPSVRSYLTEVGESDSRIKIQYRNKNGGIALATNSAADMATGDFIAFLDHDDELTPDALGEVALYLASHADCDFLYSDDDKIDEYGKRLAPQFKPDWSPELLLSYMYFSHLCVVRLSLFRDLGGINAGFEGSQDYEFALRATERARHIGHIPRILYHWRISPGSTAQSGNSKPGSMKAGLRAIQDALDRRGLCAMATQPAWSQAAGVGVFSLDFPDDGPKVTIIIPTKNSLGILKNCLNSLKNTTYFNFDVLIVDNDSTDLDTLEFLKNCTHHVMKITNPPGGFNYSFVNNSAVECCQSEYIVFLNNDTEIKNPHWLSQMVGYAGIEGVGAVGARLIYPDGRIQHAGIVHGYYKGMAGPAFKLLPGWHNGYLSYAKVARNYMAVSAACLLISRKIFTEIGGFDERDFGVAYNDVDLCYRLVDKGLRCVYSAESELIHYEGHTRGFEDKPAEEAVFKKKYNNLIDKYYNPNLSLANERFDVLPRASEIGRPVKPIRTLMVAFNLNLEGAPYSQYELTEGLKRLGVIDPIVFSPEDGPLRALYESAGIEVIVRPHPLRGVFHIDAYQASINEFAEMLRTLSVQVVYGNTLQTFYAIDAAYQLNLPSIWNPRESEPWQTYFSHFGDQISLRALRCFEHPYRVIFVSDLTRLGCEALDSKNNFCTIYNALEPSRAFADRVSHPRIVSRRSLQVGDDELMVLLLGTVCERKGQIDLIAAIKNLCSSNSLQKLRFFIVGDRQSAYSSQMHRAIDDLPEIAKSRVIVVDETRETARYFSASDIFVCSSKVESYPRVILEAMYYGLAIVTTPVFGISEQITSDISGVFYNPGDALQLAKQLEKLADDPVLRKKLSINAEFRLERLTNFDEMLRKYSDAFTESYYSAMIND